MWFQDHGIVSYLRFAGNGLYEKAFCAADSAVTLEALKRPGAKRIHRPEAVAGAVPQGAPARLFAAYGKH